MGNTGSIHEPRVRPKRIADKFESIDQIKAEFQRIGLESINLIFGIDFTKSNEYTGTKTFGGKNLHTVNNLEFNFYEKVINILGQTLEEYDDDRIIPAFYFGDVETTNKSVKSIKNADDNCNGFAEVLQYYRAKIPLIRMSGPTTFAPLIERAINIVDSTGQYHILIIVTDGDITESELDPNTESIIKASYYPLSIVCIGVGDGPFTLMKKYDDIMNEGRRFDNFQFVDFSPYINTPHLERFLVECLQEIPEQYQEIMKLKLFKNCHPIPRTIDYKLEPVIVTTHNTYDVDTKYYQHY